MITVNRSTRTAHSSIAARLAQRFQIAERHSTIRTEVVGGITAFAVMAYIIFLNPYVLTLNGMGQAPQVASFAALATATCLAAALMTIAMGWYTNYPFALAPSLDFDCAGRRSDRNGRAVLAGYDGAAGSGRPAGHRAGGARLGRCAGSGDTTPAQARHWRRHRPAAAQYWLLNAGIVRVQPEQLSTTRLPVSLGSLTALPTALALLGLLITLGLMLRHHKAALLYGILATTAIAMLAKWLVPGLAVSHASGAADLRHFVALPLDTSTIGSGLNLTAFHSTTSMVKGLGMGAALLVMVTLMLSSFLDTVGTIVGVGEQAGLVDRQGELPRAKRVLVIDSLSTAIGGLFGVSALTTYIESAAGVAAGARTGLAAIVTGLCFVLALGVTPFIGLIPPEATAPALIIVGFLMFQTVRDIDFGTLDAGFSALLTLVLIPLTCSITNGIGVGVIVYVLLSAVGGRGRAVPALLWLLAAAFVLYFLLQLG
jgi:AGZA family xanthine/uracil permease-like MFS transporter